MGSNLYSLDMDDNNNNKKMTDWKIREAMADDCGQIIKLIKGMAEYEKLSDQVKMTENQLRQDCFGAEPICKLLVVEVSSISSDISVLTKKALVGYALYFYSYSSFVGRSLYLEDLYVEPEYRSQGIGTRLWRKVAQIGVQKGCTRLDFIALSWNKNAIKLYESHGAVNLTTTEDWNLFRIDGDALKDFASSI